MKIPIEENNINRFLDVALHELAFQRDEAHVSCPQCQFRVRFPVVARDQDVEDFRKLIKVAHEVLERHGVPALLLSEIYAEVTILKASKHD